MHEPSRDELEAAHCWEKDDQVAGRPAMTAFRRRVRLHHARWREASGHPIGTQPIVTEPGKPQRLVGSRLPLDYALDTGATFLTPAAHEAASARTANKEPRQTFDKQRLWADLLWSPALSINLFGDVADDARLADRAVHAVWPDTPGTVTDVRFEHSPGRLDLSFIGSLVTLSTAFTLEAGDGTKAIVGVDVGYHEARKGQTPKPARLARYLEVADRSGAFKPGLADVVGGRSDLVVMWLQHLLVLSMLQHDSGAWSWGRFVVVHPADNVDYLDLCSRYRELLVDDSTFASTTLEELLDTGALPPTTVTALRARYLPDLGR